MMSVEQSVEWELAGETEVLGKNLLQYHFVHHKSHMTCPGTEPGPPWWETGNYSPELWHGHIFSLFFLFEKNKIRPMISPYCLCVCESPHHNNFWISESIFMELGTYINAPEPISTAYFLNPSRIHPSVARQRLGKSVTAETNTHATIEELFDVSYERKVDD
jgi:hypothetical protein